MSAQKKGSSGKPRETKKRAKNRLRIKLAKSPIGYTERQKRTVRALGLRRMAQTVEQDDTPAVRGMIAKVSHLVTVEEIR
jgi:large subunit ribosomal protein L30